MSDTTTDAQTDGMPQPDPALEKLDRLVGTWSMKGSLVGSDEDNIVGRTTYQWLEGGFFMQQDVEIDFAGMYQVKSREIIGYDPETGALSSLAYSNMSPSPLPYRWELEGDSLKITVSYDPLDATFEGRFSEDGKSIAGGWRPNPGADETVNVPYDIGGTRLE